MPQPQTWESVEGIRPIGEETRQAESTEAFELLGRRRELKKRTERQQGGKKSRKAKRGKRRRHEEEWNMRIWRSTPDCLSHSPTTLGQEGIWI